MALRTVYAAEAWDKVYDAFEQINFTAYDYNTVKNSLLQYLQIYHAEYFNDFIESSELIALLELFANVAEMMAYRVDMMSHENFITTAQRKASILKLAKLISYKPSRNIPGRGLVKVTTVSTSERITDSLGNNLADTVITWNDPNNPNWREQFFLVMGKLLTTNFGAPAKSVEIAGARMDLYTLKHAENSFTNGVHTYTASGTIDSIPMEIVPVDLDENGPFEKAPAQNSQLTIIYSEDGNGNGSDYTGFLMFTKQGTLIRTDYSIEEPVENRQIELDIVNVNDTDIWVQRVNDDGDITEVWKEVETIAEQNLIFNDITSTRKKFEVETRENDRVTIIFGDNNFADAPVGEFQIWTRSSLNEVYTIPKSGIVRSIMGFNYSANTSTIEQCSISFSLVSAIQNNAASEDIEHIRQSAPTTYYAQSRMVNGQDYNTYPLRDSSILKIATVNRTFAGQPKYIEWNDASRTYENTKMFGDDLSLYYDISLGQIETTLSTRLAVDSFIEPLLQDIGIINAINHISATVQNGYGIISNPRRVFIEDNRGEYQTTEGLSVTPYGSLSGLTTAVTAGALNEKTVIQAALDQHWYGDATSFATIGGVRHAIISDPVIFSQDDGKLYDENLPRTIDGINTYPPGDTGSGLQTVPAQAIFGLKFNRFLKMFGDGTITLWDPLDSIPMGEGPVTIEQARASTKYPLRTEVFTIEMLSDGTTFSVTSSIRGKMTNYSMTPEGDGGPSTTQNYIKQNSSSPINFNISRAVASEFEQGDAFIVDVARDSVDGLYKANVRSITTGIVPNYGVNLNGWWQLISSTEVVNTLGIQISSGPTVTQVLDFDPNDQLKSWVILVATSSSGTKFYYRSVKLIAESASTRFWHSNSSQITDPETGLPVVDNIKVLRSNLDADGQPLRANEVYDVIGPVFNSDGSINFNKLEVIPNDSSGFTVAGDAMPDNLLQFEEFARFSYEYYLIDMTTNPPTIGDALGCDDFEIVADGYDDTIHDIDAYDANTILVGENKIPFSFAQGQWVSLENDDLVPFDYAIGRRHKVPAPVLLSLDGETSECNALKGLDFMWQHFSPVSNLIDPSVTNIHDSFIITRGYYDNVISYVKGEVSEEPTPPTPLELRNSYGYLLENKMLSDTVVLHSGKIKLLFGSLADVGLRAKFRVVKHPTGSFSIERIKREVVSVIDTFFSIENWDFGETFYATELIALIHQRLGGQIASVVIVPMSTVNSFGSLFTIEAGFDEILQSAAGLDDVEIVDALTPTVLRQN